MLCCIDWPVLSSKDVSASASGDFTTVCEPDTVSLSPVGNVIICSEFFPLDFVNEPGTVPRDCYLSTWEAEQEDRVYLASSRTVRVL